MIEFDSKKWEFYDPDGILARSRDTISGLNFDLEKARIFPREDMMCFKHTEKSIIIDFGFYGDEVDLVGEWIVYVVDIALDGPWDAPIDRIKSKLFLDGINNVQSAIRKYA